MATYKKNPPEANVLMESMRAMGYSFESAIADVLDNSLTAHSRNIQLVFPVDPQDCYVAICDDGKGMTNSELYNAMKYGCNINEGNRSEYDLGRFGLGLKSASLSQCKNLTVASKCNGIISAYVWDIDFVKSQMDWIIQELDEEEISNIREVDRLNELESGTVVLWQKFDVIEKSTGDVFTTLDSYKERTAEYLSLIFHRFINSEKQKRVTIKINNFIIVGLDPFLEKHKKTNPRKEIGIPIEDSNGIERYIIVSPYVLPFQKDMDKDDYKKIGGVQNYRTKQGYYIYRNERLIVWGTWFGLPKNELTKNARIKVDIPNTLDDIWGIDIKKQKATIPKIIRAQLKRAVDEAMDIAINSQVYRGRIQNVNEDLDYVWDRIKVRNEKYICKINRTSRIFDFLKDADINDDILNRFEMILEELENTLPYQQIYIDMSGNKIADETETDRLSDVCDKARFLIKMSFKMGNLDLNNIIDKIFISEPFCKYSQLKEKLQGEYKSGN
ncbi:ATP-binding protein [Clostridium sp. CF012]|uniref:ATP-binding protein n=1 Tax=Clostridium sp. CF012 TaxID=2843319 RepID=UPI001C0D0046|nr:ATP-binding protein [Clostridium sp. CF012]MBU3144631.1 ATP-binding protein [Clostridium sp. CF012]